ncbi:MAG: L-erythro-3,5-diaminohexanoate dehydrogenase [Firmicutes bacterium]|nr:L-erythro-3,5-diaminohexanoate dehydrogenase [Bacillota bacterium]NLO65706.1 L-erythro-3,5-diaminohexanoate dehydrogenase [Bacillota bacterium]
MTVLCPYGTHRVIEPVGALPQGALRLDNRMESYPNELLLDVETLNIDSASFTQIRQEAGDDPARIGEIMMEIVRTRGKHHNPVTGSGGMFIGTVKEIGKDLQERTDLQIGDRIASLVSLTLTPLVIDKVKAIDLETAQVDIDGQAILFESGIYAVLPEDLPQKLALAALDVAGAPAQTAKLVKPGDTVLIVGAGGKSGCLCLHEARKRAGVSGTVIAMDFGEAAVGRIKKLELADIVLNADATKPVDCLALLQEASGKLADLTINCVNIPNTEMTSILCTRDGGIVYFFSMATSFTAAALGAEGVGKDVNMLIGNGYTKDHAKITLQVLRENPKLRQLFEEIYV